jgi:CheY-like chemotaxis protein
MSRSGVQVVDPVTRNASCPELADEGPFRTHHAELVAFRVGEDGPGLGAGLPDVHPPSTKPKDALDLGLLLARIGAQVEVEAILDCLDAVLDVLMPDIDGYTICARIRADASLAAVPVIIVTANYGSADLEAARRAGATDFLVKPFHPVVLLDKAKAMLSEGG